MQQFVSKIYKDYLEERKIYSYFHKQLNNMINYIMFWHLHISVQDDFVTSI
jgi:hypothetical protein